MKKILKNNLERIVSIIIILLIVYILNLVLNKIINKIIKKRNNKNLTTILMFIKKLKSLVIYLVGILICLSKFEMFSSLSVTLLGAIGIVTTILGLAAQEILKNFFGSRINYFSSF